MEGKASAPTLWVTGTGLELKTGLLTEDAEGCNPYIFIRHVYIL